MSVFIPFASLADGTMATDAFWTVTNSVDSKSEIFNDLLWLYYNGSSQDQLAYVSPGVTVSGDFDIRVKFKELLAMGSAQDGFRLSVYNSTDATDYGYVAAGINTGTKFMHTIVINNSIVGSQQTAPRTNIYGELRLVRSGSTLTSYYKDGNGSWTQLYSYASFITDAVIIKLSLRNASTSGTTHKTVYVHQIEVAAGTVSVSGALSGVVEQNGSPVARKVRCYNRATAKLLAETTSSAVDGSFSFGSFANAGECYIIAFDDDAGDDYNALISDRVTPG
jgi:hypothetical protein